MAQYFKDTSLSLRKSYRYVLSGQAEPDDIKRWLDLGNNALYSANVLWRTSLSVPERQKLQAAVALIKSTLHLLRECRVGAGLAEPEGAPAISGGEVLPAANWEDLESAFENRIKTGMITNNKHLDVTTFMRDVEKQFVIRVNESLEVHSAVKVNAVLAAEYVIVKDDKEIVDIKYFNTKTMPIYSTTDLKDWFLTNVQQTILTDMEEFQERESGWSLQSILHLILNINKFNPMRGSSFIELPKFIAKKKACINVKNNDNQCFKWAILSALHPVSNNAHRVSAYDRYKNELNFHGIEFPVDPKQVNKFEKQNNISVNIYFLKKKGQNYNVLPRHLTTRKQVNHVNLLLIESFYVDEDEEEQEEEFLDSTNTFHYVWIKDLSRLVRNQLTLYRGKIHICDRCLHYFHTNEKLVKHVIDCEKLNQCKIVLPTNKNSVLEFKNFAFENRVPYVVYADFECLLKPVNDDKKHAYQHHQAFSVGYYVKCSYDDSQSVYKSYRQQKEEDEAPAKWFVKNLQTLALQLEGTYKDPKSMKSLTFSQIIDFGRARACHICRKPFTKDDKKVRDHCHLTGEYRGPAHNSCNISYQDSRTIPVVFHNLSGYDAHLFIKEIATCFPGRLSLLPQTKEKYISFTKFVEGTDINLRFIDSFKFMASSLDKLSSYLVRQDILEQVFEKDDGFSKDQMTLLKRKGVFPYDYVSSFDKLDEKALPSQADFYSSLYEAHITDEEYQHAERVWKDFKIQSLGHYSDLYLKTDVLLLTEVFENFRSNCLEAYGLDPAHYYTTPGLTWDAMLKYTQVNY